MGHSRAEKEKSRERILEAAARMIRERGPDGVSIADLMKSANLTHGGFYGHFPSRDALVLAAVERAIADGSAAFAALPDGEEPGSVKSIVHRYLSTPHRDNAAGGCALAALASDAGRMEDRQCRQALGEYAEGVVRNLAGAMGGGAEAEDAALAAWCTMIGAVALSRVFRGTKRADEVLKVARRAVLDAAPAPPAGEGPARRSKRAGGRAATRAEAGEGEKESG